MSGRRYSSFLFWFPGAAILVLVATVLHTDLLGPVLLTGRAAFLKMTGRGTICTWRRIFEIDNTINQFAELRAEFSREIEVLEKAEGGLLKISSPIGPFWVREESSGLGIEYLFAEHTWNQNTNSDGLVRRGDVVIDVGSHVGVFVATALGRGASQVIAIEPDPRNIECLRRNFPAEIAASRVLVVAEGAWSSAGTLQLYLGQSSAWSSVVKDLHTGVIDVPVRPLDDIVDSIGIERVDYIKMDIEGAEREALKGAMNVLRRDHPTVMLDSHQLPDDMEVLPEIMLGVDPHYRLICGACQFEHGRLVPHVTFYRYGN